MEPSVGLVQSIVLHSGTQVLQIAALALLMGWVAEQLLDTGIRIRGLALFCGIAGLYLGSWIWAVGGWANGPTVAGLGIMPMFAGSLAVSGFFKLLALGASGPRW
jgi:hypothetical protein